MDIDKSDEKNSSNLNGLILNHVGFFHDITIQRKETIDETLNNFHIEDEFEVNINLLDRTTHLYRVTKDDFTILRESLIKNDDFVHIEVINKSSAIGLPYQIYAKHKNGNEIYFDGLMYITYKIITNNEISIDSIPELAGHPYRDDKVVFSFEESLRAILPDIPERSYSMYSFYTSDVQDWKQLGINNSGDAQLRLLVNDENIITITALVHSKVGKLYPVYLGNTEIIRTMKSHDMFYIYEFKRFSKFIDKEREKVSKASTAISHSMQAITNSFLRFYSKHKAWAKAKSGLNTIREVKTHFYKYDLLCESIDVITTSRWTSCNAPKQIWLDGEEKNDQWLNSYWCQNFFQGRLIDGEIKDIEDKPIEPSFSYAANVLVNKVDLLKKETNESLSSGHNLLSAIQAELSMYAVWMAIIAILISTTIGVAAVLIS